LTVVYSKDLVDRIRDALAAHPSVREVRMLGGLSFMVNEKMVVCVRSDGDLLVRSDPEQADELLTLEGACSAEMGAGRPMSKSWISVGQEAIATEAGVDFWIEVALEYNKRAAATSPRRSRTPRRPR
jgi:TfoX/Sxy family transcriptional regulator of competence genes